MLIIIKNASEFEKKIKYFRLTMNVVRMNKFDCIYYLFIFHLQIIIIQNIRQTL